MKNPRLLKIYDLVKDVQQLDELITLHKTHSADSFMLSQYQARKDKLFAQIIQLFAGPVLASSSSYLVIQQLIARFYKDPLPTQTSINDEDLRELEQLITP
ncbi:hypothetical protein F5984_00650 [Rudanella paleaurantiibacter]|uniref:Uncharacterized protein n=1 Tax=Rudanella paleaurantiibacter TaxID=2614655 RepID=A0A7J5U3T3_9BACT|nr:hypothetical protein [Rudanella paleaurantiibacter]KAB7732504.1 hypothetical protein F5984_00650 [Rudanella paleaurantiibacter]